MSQNHYQVLGVGEDASADDIKKAYRKLAMKYHPDRNSDANALEKIKEVNDAYAVLGDPVKKADYDASLRVRQTRFDSRDFCGFRSRNADIFGDGDCGGWSRSAHYSDDDADLFSEAFRNAYEGKKNQDCTIKLNVKLTDAFKGREYMVTYTTQDGIDRKVQLKVPAGIETGKKMKCAGGGCENFSWLPPGDLYVEITVVDEAPYRLHGRDVYCEVPIDMFSLICGTTIQVHTIDGAKLAVDIREKTQPYSKIRIPGRGMNSLSSDKRGDMFIEFKVGIPEGLTEENMDLLRGLKDECAAAAIDEKGA